MGKFLKTFWGRVTAAVTFLAGVAAILSLLLAAGVIRQPFSPVPTPTVTCNSALSDNFTGSTLSPRWEQVNLFPNTQATYTVANGQLRLSAPAGVDLYAGTNFDAPHILEAATGNFTVQTTVALEATTNMYDDDYQGSGILILQDQRTYIRLEQGYRGTTHDVEFAAYVNGTVVYTMSQSAPSSQITLKIQRRGDSLTGWWSGSDGALHEVGQTAVHLANTKVGLLLVTYSGSPSNVVTSASFDGFTFTCG